MQAGESNRLSFVASEYDNLVAVFDIVEYDVVWNYYATGADWDAQNTDNLTTETPNHAKEHYLYGEKLSADLDAGEEDYVFCGWQIAGDETKKDYKYATFVVPERIEEKEEEKEPVEIETDSVENAIELNAHWRMANPYSVLYYTADGKLITTDEVYETKDNYTLKTPETLETEISSVTLKDGYRYYWSTDVAGASVITGFETMEGDVSVYLQERIITYTVKVENDELGFANYNNNSTFTFTVEDYSNLTEVVADSNWTKTYSYHMVSGVSYNGGTYNTASQILEKVFETNRHTELESEIVLTPVVNGYKYIVAENLKLISYPEISDGIPEGKQNAVYGGNGYEFSLAGGAVKVLARNDEGTIKLLNIFELLGLKDENEEEIVTLYDKADEETREMVTLRAIKITLEGKEESDGIVINGNTSACELIEKLINAGIITAGTNQDTLTIKNIKVMFCPESVQG